MRRDLATIAEEALKLPQNEQLKLARTLLEKNENYPRNHDCFLSKVPSPFLTRRAIFPRVWPD